MENNELTHWGVRGMKWGIRRYQNKDGTLTPAGKKRYASEMEKLKAEEKVLKNKQRTKAKFEKIETKKKELEELRKKVEGKMTDAEKKAKAAEKEAAKKADKDAEAEKVKDTEKNSGKINKSVRDMSDAELREVVARLDMEKRYRDLNPRQVSAGEQFTKNVLKPAAESAGKVVLTEAITKLGKKFMGLDKKDDMDSFKKEVEKLKLQDNYEVYKDRIAKRAAERKGD